MNSVKRIGRMKVSRDQVAKNRQRILEVAGTLFREKGFEGVAVADIMQHAGLTHGGFYGHFASKEDLAARSCADAVARTVNAWTALADDRSSDQLDAFVASYLSPRHRDDAGGGCVLAALGADVARQRGAVRRAFTEGIRSTVAMIARLSAASTESAISKKSTASRKSAPSPKSKVSARSVSTKSDISAALHATAPGQSDAQREHALATLSGLVGALTLARAADDPALSDEILHAALKAFSRKSAG
jgi:TetR/AcrR family transcriptional regulator, transcriptional repressor for nem operon